MGYEIAGDTPRGKPAARPDFVRVSHSACRVTAPGRGCVTKPEGNVCRRARRPGQGLPGSGENNSALPGLSFHSSASAGGSPLRVMFGHCAA